MTKVYELAGKAAGKLYTEFCGSKIELNFKGGLGSQGSNTAVLITSEPFVQDAIESDSRFGSVIRLVRNYDNPAQARNAYQQNGSPVVDSNAQAIARQLAEAEAVAAEQQATEEQKKQEMRARRQAAKKKAAKDPEPETAVVAEEEGAKIFKNANEALHYFIAQGEEVSADNLEALLKEHNCKIAED